MPHSTGKPFEQMEKMKKKVGISYSTTNFSFYWDWFQSLEDV